MDAVLDAGRLRGQSLLVCVCTFSVMILDGFDVQIIGFAAPALVAEFGIERSALGPALAASVLGMCLGAIAIGRIGDRFGRRPALLASTVLFGATTLLGATATGVTSLAAWRFLTGLGLGAALPSAVALMAEFSPEQRRSQLIVGSLLGVPIGGILGSALAAELVPEFGWRAIFIAGGVLPLIAAAALLALLPESPRFLAARADLAATADEHGAFRAAFAPGLARDTWVLALAFFANMIAVYAFFSWVPLVLTLGGIRARPGGAQRTGVQPRRHRGKPAQRLADLAHRLAPAAGAGGEYCDIRPGRADLRGRIRRRRAAHRLSTSRPLPPPDSASTRCRPACTSCRRMSFPPSAARPASDSHPAPDVSAASSAPLRAEPCWRRAARPDSSSASPSCCCSPWQACWRCDGTCLDD